MLIVVPVTIVLLFGIGLVVYDWYTTRKHR